MRQTKREKALMALLSTDSIYDAARACNVPISEILQIWDTEDFKSDYRKALHFLAELDFMIRLLEIVCLQNTERKQK